MPRVSVWLVRASLAHLAAGVTLGAVLQSGLAGWWFPLDVLALLSVHMELVLVGWLVQLAVGVGFWILPPVRGGAVRERPAWTVFALLNLGILLFVLDALWTGAGPTGRPLATVARALEAAGVMVFGLSLATKPFR